MFLEKVTKEAAYSSLTGSQAWTVRKVSSCRLAVFVSVLFYLYFYLFLVPSFLFFFSACLLYAKQRGYDFLECFLDKVSCLLITGISCAETILCHVVPSWEAWVGLLTNGPGLQLCHFDTLSGFMSVASIISQHLMRVSLSWGHNRLSSERWRKPSWMCHRRPVFVLRVAGAKLVESIFAQPCRHVSACVGVAG